MVDCCRSRRPKRSIGIVSSTAVVVITATAKNMDQVDLAETHLRGRLWQDASPVHLPYMQWSQWNLCGGQKSFARCIRGSHCCAASVFVSKIAPRHLSTWDALGVHRSHFSPATTWAFPATVGPLTFNISAVTLVGIMTPKRPWWYWTSSEESWRLLTVIIWIPPVAVLFLRAEWTSTGIDDHHWPALLLAPGEPILFACRSTVFEPHWLSLFCAPTDPQLGSRIDDHHWPALLLVKMLLLLVAVESHWYPIAYSYSMYRPWCFYCHQTSLWIEL